MKITSIALAILVIAANASLLVPLNAYAAESSKVQTIASLYQKKDTLVGKSVTAQGKVVKVNNKIMGRNFLHIQDSSGDAKAGTNDLVVTSSQTANMGDLISITGKVVVNRDFGYGYTFPLLIEEAEITPKK